MPTYNHPSRHTLMLCLFVLLASFVFLPHHKAKATTVTKVVNEYYIDNGNIAIKVPASAANGMIPAPILGIRYNGVWYGSGSWETRSKLKNFTALALIDGIQLNYLFNNDCGIDSSYLQIIIRLRDGANEASVEETYRMEKGAKYIFTASDGWEPNNLKTKQWYWANGSMNNGGPDNRDKLLPLIQRERWSKTLNPNVLVYMQPRWTQSADAVYVAEVTNNYKSIGIAVCRAGKWFLPHDGYIYCRSSEKGGDAYYDFPTQRGGRYYLLYAGLTTDINHHNMIDSYQGYSGNPKFYDPNTNPTGAARNKSAGLLKILSGGGVPSCNPQEILNYLHPDYYGYPFNLWSPINPNFYSDVVIIPAMMACGCTNDPMFAQIKEKLEDALRRHIENTWTLPGGAGECPGYNIYGYHELEDVAPYLKKYLDIDFMNWPQMLEATKHIEEVGRTPQGDTHPPGKYKGNLNKTKEYPHYGVVFVNGKETLNWKAGPMRGHYHGDQLSFHWWDKAIDHQTSYSPRADQEHLHNRVAFTNNEWEYANMDGYEKIIAFQTQSVADASIAQVSSNRMRKQPPLASDYKWQGMWPERKLDTMLTYRRTIVMVKGNTTYFVIRDQHKGPNLHASYYLHTTGDVLRWNGSNIANFNTMSVFVAKPTSINADPFFVIGRHGSGFTDPTNGMRMTISGPTSEFITVLWPGGTLPTCTSLPNGVQVGADVITFGDPTTTANDAVVTVNGQVIIKSSDIDFNRNQGEGYLDKLTHKWDGRLFIPEAGYPMGPTPEWLLAQRLKGYQVEDCNNREFTYDLITSIEKPIPVPTGKLKVFPNPTNGTIHFEGVGRSEFRVRIYNLLGVEVISTSLNKNEINLSALPSGVYAVAVETNRGWVTNKITKQ